jgi:hypothetical protein
MSESNLFNQYISAHNISLTEGVFFFKLVGHLSYSIVWDTRTHPLSLFTSSTKPEIVHRNVGDAKKKLFSSLRDKFNEQERPFSPRFYHNQDSLRLLVSRDSVRIEKERGVIRVLDNIPVFTMFPLWSFLGQPILSLIIRVPSVFHFFSCRDEFKELLLGLETSLSEELLKFDPLKYVEDKEGQGPLTPISFRHTRFVDISDIVPKAETIIDFESFEILDSEAYTIITDIAFLESINDYDIQPQFALVKRTEVELDIPITHFGYTLCTWIDSEGKLFEFCSLTGKSEDNGDDNEDTSSRTGVIVINPGEDQQTILPFVLNMIRNAQFLLYSRVFQPSRISAPAKSVLRYRMEGTFVPPEKKLTSSIPFREPMSCTSIDIESLKSSDYPIFAQYKLDGNRIVVYLLDEGASIKYYTRNGNLQSRKFNIQFDKAVTEFYQRVTRSFQRANPTRRIRNIMLDCECYSHDVVHSDIGGWCNRIESSENFRKLNLYILSWLDLDTLKVIEERKRLYTISSLTFEESLGNIENLIDENSNLLFNPSYLIESQKDMFEVMSASVEQGFEGIVLYPTHKHYTFSNAGLKKIKKFFDGECQVLSYKESETEPGVIGSILVRTREYFKKEANAKYVDFYVNAALKNTLKPNSMHSALFQNCIGKEFTIICGSFSDTGVPIHARFKTAFSPENERLDQK